MGAPSRFDPLQGKAQSLRYVSPSNGQAENDLSCLFYYREIALNSFLMDLKETSSFFTKQSWLGRAVVIYNCRIRTASAAQKALDQLKADGMLESS
jgi:hypothetical protein